MPIHERRTDRGARVAVVLHRHLGSELRSLRRQAGLSQRRIASEIGVDHGVVSRIEAGAAGATTLATYARLFAVLGVRLSVKVYPEGQAMRDEAHLRLIARLRRLLHAAIRIRTEVPLGIGGDLRAWDAELSIEGGSVMVEAETALDDVQALERRIALKCRDGNVDVVLLLVSDTARTGASSESIVRCSGRGSRWTPAPHLPACARADCRRSARSSCCEVVGAPVCPFAWCSTRTKPPRNPATRSPRARSAAGWRTTCTKPGRSGADRAPGAASSAAWCTMHTKQGGRPGPAGSQCRAARE